MSRFLDERGRIFGKVNVVDILVLLAVIALIVFAVVRTQGSSSPTVAAVVTFRVEQVRQATVDVLLAAHGTIRDDGGTTLGKVKSATAQPSQEEVVNPLTGKLETQPSPLYQDVDITVSGRVSTSGGLDRIGGVAMQVGDKVNLVGAPNFKVAAVVTKVSK
ncbi:MAG TPA: DUF4330 domain-containing protein [Thermoleophilia bacterium]